MGIEKDISQLLEAKVISSDTALSIKEYYHKGNSITKTKLLVLCSVLGAIFIGGGIVLIFAHNWNIFSRQVKTIIAFVPLFFAQLLCVIALLKKKKSIGLTEGSTAFLFVIVGASMALVSQIYQIQGSLSKFMVVWLLLMLPVLYIFCTPTLSLLCSLGIAYLSGHLYLEAFALTHNLQIGFYELGAVLLLLFLLPFYIYYQKKNTRGAIVALQNWCICITLIFSVKILVIYFLGSLKYDVDYVQYFTYALVCLLLYLFGTRIYPIKKYSFINAYKIFGIVVLFVVVFINMSDFLTITKTYDDNELEFLTTRAILLAHFVIAVLMYALVQYASIKKIAASSSPKRKWHVDNIEIMFILLIVIGILQHSFDVVIHFTFGSLQNDITLGVVLVNILVMYNGIALLIQGKMNTSVEQMNIGMLCILLWFIVQFFDANFPYLLKGMIFVLLGIFFLVMNVAMLTICRKKHE